MANKRMQIRPLYVKDNEIYAKDVGNGKDKLYIEDITETKSYTLRRGVTKGEGVLKVLDDDVWKDQVFDEWDLSEVPLDQGVCTGTPS